MTRRDREMVRKALAALTVPESIRTNTGWQKGPPMCEACGGQPPEDPAAHSNGCAYVILLKLVS